ncbi:MAG: phosphatidylglycerophosphatase A [Xanthomonadales bacterium]|nr:phosphatidylglycerophosphatase A [Xanthomonadales bacterium]
MNESEQHRPGLSEDELTDDSPGIDSQAIRVRARALAFGTPDGFIAFGFGTGLQHFAPGTLGTLAAVPIAVLMGLSGMSLGIFAFITFWLGVWLCGRVSAALGVEDYGGIVFDEMVGFWVVAAFIPLHWAWYLAAFVLFRGFDILKPWPISWLEENLTGGLGIMVDDLLAALYTIILLRFVLQMLNGA